MVYQSQSLSSVPSVTCVLAHDVIYNFYILYREGEVERGREKKREHPSIAYNIYTAANAISLT